MINKIILTTGIKDEILTLCLSALLLIALHGLKFLEVQISMVRLHLEKFPLVRIEAAWQTQWLCFQFQQILCPCESELVHIKSKSTLIDPLEQNDSFKRIMKSGGCFRGRK